MKTKSAKGSTIAYAMPLEKAEPELLSIEHIRRIAGDFGIEQSLSELRMIRSIQMMEGNEPCFGSKECSATVCLWHGNCQRSFKNATTE